MNEKMFNDWLLKEEHYLQKEVDSGEDGPLAVKKLMNAIKLEFLKDILKVFKQCQCEHKNTSIQECVGYDVDEEGEEDQHLETCHDCHAERFHCDHTKHGKTTGEWFISI